MHTVHEEVGDRCIQCISRWETGAHSASGGGRQVHTVHQQVGDRCIQCIRRWETGAYSA